MEYTSRTGDLRGRSLRERKQILHEHIEFTDPIRFTEHRNADGPRLLSEACDRGWEGLIARRADSPSRSGRSRDWLKLKCVAQQEFVIVGYTDPEGSRTDLGALVLAYHDSNDDLVDAGRVGTGFDASQRRELRTLLDRRSRATSPIDGSRATDGINWATPDLVCEVGFTEWTDDGKLRHPRYLGLRHDKHATDVVREQPEVIS